MAGGVVFRAIYISKDPPRIGAFAGLSPSVGSPSSTLSGGLGDLRITTASNLSNSRLFPQGLGDLGRPSIPQDLPASDASRTRSYGVVTPIYSDGISRTRRTSFFPVGRPPSASFGTSSERLGSSPFFLAFSSLRDRLELAYSRRSIVARSDEKRRGFSPLAPR